MKKGLKGLKNPYKDMSEEEALLAKSENRSLLRFIASFLFSCVYGLLALFAVFRLRETLPPLLYSLNPGHEGNDTARLYTAVVIIAAGLAWVISFVLLWRKLSLTDKPSSRKLLSLALFCAGAGLVLMLCEVFKRLITAV